MDYMTTLPDFLAMQRMSFCWFIVQGLTEELVLFSTIYDFSKNIEYVIFGHEFILLQSLYKKSTARRYGRNYSTQLMIPIEIRNKRINDVKYHKEYSIINLPLMTSSATFIINGCERVIISQIIRSPGVYFEKNKTQRRPKQIPTKLACNLAQLGSLFPIGEPYLTDTSLFFQDPDFIAVKDSKFQKRFGYKMNTLKFVGKWSHILTYKLAFVQEESNFQFYLIKSLNLYFLIAKIKKYKKKKELINIFIQWLTFKKNFYTFKNYRQQQKVRQLLKYFNILFKFLKKYRVEQQPNRRRRSKDDESKKIIIKSQKLVPITLNSDLITLNTRLNKIKSSSQNFLCLTKEFYKQHLRTKESCEFFQNQALNLKLSIATSLKDKLMGVRTHTGSGRVKNEYAHKYLTTKGNLLKFKEKHKIETPYYNKYNENELYTAIIIPEFGSWIRFGFQKNNKLNLYRFPIKNKEDDIVIQIDKIHQIPVLNLFKELGLTDFEIYSNLHHSDFFYFTKPLFVNPINLEQPLARFTLDSSSSSKISGFSIIFDPVYYRMGKIGRLRLNNRLNMEIAQRVQTITYEDIFAIIDQLLSLSVSKNTSDDIDHLKNRRVRSVGELLQSLFRIAFLKIVRKIGNQTNKKPKRLSNFTLLAATIREFFSSSQLSQYLDQTNPLSSLTHRRRISALGPGGLDKDRISFRVRDIHPSHYGRICPIETPEGQNVGLISSLTTCGRVNNLGFLETPFWRVLNGKVIKIGNPVYLTAEIEDLYRIAPGDIITNKENYLIQSLIPVRYKQDFISVPPFEVDFIAISPIQIVSIAASLIPFFEHDDANRALMGSNMQRQSVPLIMPQKPIVGTGLEYQIAHDSDMGVIAQESGTISLVTSKQIKIKNSNSTVTHNLYKYIRSNQETCINQRPIVWKGEKVKKGQLICDGPGIVTNELALGQNVLVAYAPWQGYNFEDAILLNERLIYEDIFTSIHIERYAIDVIYTEEIYEEVTKDIPNLTDQEIRHLNDNGIVRVGTFVKPGDILVGKTIENNDSEELPEEKLLRAIFGVKAKGVTDTSYRMPVGEYGRVLETITVNRQSKLGYKFEKINVLIAKIRKIKVGDKIAGRHGNKGIVSRILPRQDMPFLPDGTPIDIILNPLGVPSRMNVGQLYECLLGLAGDKLNRRFKVLPFDEMYGAEVSRILINKKLRQASVMNNEAWLFNPYAPGKMVLIDGRTGKEFENPITVGNAYMLKLIHLVDDKMHARSTGPYSIVTQQPLGGKAQEGGQRFGEMEVWALEGFGAAFTLRELLTIKSDDIDGRNETVTSIIKNQQIPMSGIPESFKVLLQELRSIGVDLNTYKIEQFGAGQNWSVKVDLIEMYDPLSKIFSSTSNIDDISF